MMFGGGGLRGLKAQTQQRAGGDQSCTASFLKQGRSHGEFIRKKSYRTSGFAYVPTYRFTEGSTAYRVESKDNTRLAANIAFATEAKRNWVPSNQIPVPQSSHIILDGHSNKWAPIIERYETTSLKAFNKRDVCFHRRCICVAD